MKRLRERVNDLFNVVRELTTAAQVLRETLDLLSRGDLAGQQEPEHRLREHLLTRAANVGSRREGSLALRNALAVEGDTFLSVKDGTLPEHALQATHTTDKVADLAVTERAVSVL